MADTCNRHQVQENTTSFTKEHFISVWLVWWRRWREVFKPIKEGNKTRKCNQGYSPNSIKNHFFFTVIIKFLTIGSFQEMLRQEAVEAIAKLKIRKFRRRVKDSSHYAIKQVEQERRDSEVCAVCLDEFQNNQVRIDETE